MGGGDMIKSVTFERSTWNDLPHKFEAGTPDIAGAVGLGAALDYITSIGLREIEQHEQRPVGLCDRRPRRDPGTAPDRHRATERRACCRSSSKASIPHDIGTIVDREGVAIRTGHHCAQPVMDRFGVPATARASLAMYNTREDVDALGRALLRVREVFG